MDDAAQTPTSDSWRPDCAALAALEFDNRFTTELTPDPEAGPGTRQVPRAAFSRVDPVRTSDPRIVAWTPDLAEALGLGGDVLASDDAARVFTGNALLPGSDPHAANYGGHQFGNWAGQLGDGRAIALGEVVDADGRHQTLQLKGAGPTPYSRRADGLAVLRSSIREFLCSEAMYHLGVPTTRALTLATTGTEVMRDMFYDGHPALEPGAIVCRVAPSFLRFGTYQLPAARGEIAELRQLADFTIRHYFPHLLPDRSSNSGYSNGSASNGSASKESASNERARGERVGHPPEVYERWFDEVCRSSCDLVVEWMRVGFVHGVMNTDNMSIHGLTIDYGPYGWLDDYDPNWTPNTTDAGGRRYRYGYQPQITQWNLLQLANALYPLVERAEGFEASLTGFADRYRTGHRTMMLAKLGLDDRHGEAAVAEDDELIDELTQVLQLVETDMTIFFRRLADVVPDPDAGRRTAGTGSVDLLESGLLESGLLESGLLDAYYSPADLDDVKRARIDGWLRRYRDRLAVEPKPAEARRSAMHSINPKFVVRNYLAQLAIDEAQRGDYALVHELAEVLRRPYDEQPAFERHAEKRPDWARSRPGCSMLSCSS